MHLIGSKTQAKTQFIVYTEYGFWWPFWNANAFPITFFCYIDLRLVWARFGCWLPFSYIVTKRLTDIFICQFSFSLYLFFLLFFATIAIIWLPYAYQFVRENVIHWMMKRVLAIRSRMKHFHLSWIMVHE